MIGAQPRDEGGYHLHETDEDLQGDINALVEGGWSFVSETTNKLYRSDV